GGSAWWPLASLIREYTCFEKKCIVLVLTAAADALEAIIAVHTAIDTDAHLIRLMIPLLVSGCSPSGPAPPGLRGVGITPFCHAVAVHQVRASGPGSGTAPAPRTRARSTDRFGRPCSRCSALGLS